jgi:RNA polymerase sigma-32 factor
MAERKQTTRSGTSRRRRARGPGADGPDGPDRDGRAADGGSDGGSDDGSVDSDGDQTDAEPDDDPETILGEVVDDEEDAGDIDAELERLVGQPDVAGQKRADARVALLKRDPLTAYIQETRRHPLLDREEEHALAVRLVEEGDTNAARRLIESNLRLVVKIAYEYRRAHRNLLDLIQEGNIGLMQAVKKYDPYRGVKLSSYAAWWIRAYILKFVLNNWRLVKIGTTQAQRKLFFNLRKEREKLEQLGFQPTTALLAEKLDVSEREVIEMERRLAAPEASLDAPLGSGDDDGVRTRLDFLPSEADRPDRAVAQSEFSQLLRGKLEAFAATLAGREQTIFRERWLTDEPLTLQEIGDRYNVSRERARQLEKRMLDRLKKYLEAELGAAVDIGALTRD